MCGHCENVSLLFDSLAIALLSDALAISPKSSDILSWIAEATANSGVCKFLARILVTVLIVADLNSFKGSFKQTVFHYNKPKV